MTARLWRSALATLADPDLRIGIGLAGLALSGLAVRERSIGRREAAVFRAVNGLPDELFLPAWVVMQAGTLAAGPVAGAVAWACGRPRLAGQLALGGVGSWALSKPIKRVYRRPRPSSLIESVRTRGPEASGLGYVSGHAGVAVALGVAAFGNLSRAGRSPIGSRSDGRLAVSMSAHPASTSPAGSDGLAMRRSYLPAR
jgi:hypothetical protein